MTFEQLHAVARAQDEAVQAGEVPDAETGAVAILVTRTLFDLIATFADASSREAVAGAVCKALGIEPAP